MQIVDLENIRNLAVMPYGKPGSGKTHFISTACDDDRTYPMLHVDVSGNPETIAKRKRIVDGKVVPVRKPYVVRLQKLHELNAIYDWFIKGQPDNHPMVDKMGCRPGYKCLSFDGVTAVQRKSFGVVLGQENLLPGDIPVKPEWGHYAAVLRQMLIIAAGFLQELRGVNIHVIVSCLEHEETRYIQPGVASTMYKYYEPGLQGQAVTELPGEALAVMRFAHKSSLPIEMQKAPGLKDAKRVIAQLTENGKAYAKDQHGLGGIQYDDALYLADPTVTQLLDAIGAE